jgi:hypothetical protein
MAGAFSDGRSGIAYTAELAAQELRKAEKLTRRRALDQVDAALKMREAERTRDDGERILTVPKHLVGDVSTELVPALGYSPDADTASIRHHVVATLEEPNVISVDASEHRAHAATKAGVLSAALDSSVSAGARNSLDKMIAHQVAAAHHAGMELLGRLADSATFERLPPVELARLTNAAARLFDVSQGGCITLQRMKTGGKQHVIVQHVTVSQGGQAVVAGRVEGGRRRRGKGQD